MPIFSPKFFSIVFPGRHNPQILSHDFLINHQVLPTRKEPFKSLIKNSSKEKLPFTHYLSTPLVTTLVYDWISIIIEQERYQIKDTNFGVPSQSPIISITRSYFGKLLRYTPFRLGGTNFGGEITFLDKDDERDFDERLGIDSQKFETYLNIVGARFSTRIKFPCDRNQEDEIELQVDKPEKSSAIGILNFNCEFLYEDIDSFVKKLDEVNRVYKKFKQILKKLGVETKQ